MAPKSKKKWFREAPTFSRFLLAHWRDLGVVVCVLTGGWEFHELIKALSHDAARISESASVTTSAVIEDTGEKILRLTSKAEELVDITAEFAGNRVQGLDGIATGLEQHIVEGNYLMMSAERKAFPAAVMVGLCWVVAVVLTKNSLDGNASLLLVNIRIQPFNIKGRDLWSTTIMHNGVSVKICNWFRRHKIILKLAPIDFTFNVRSSFVFNFL